MALGYQHEGWRCLYAAEAYNPTEEQKSIIDMKYRE